MQYDELKYLLALKEINGVGDVLAKHLIREVGHPKEVFQLSAGKLLKIPKISEKVAKEIVHFQHFDAVEKELIWCEEQSIRIVSFQSEDYPKRLLECHDSPLLLFVKGNAHLNPSKIVSIVGTRKNTEYGQIITERIVEALAPLGVTIVSGLALGIDGIAHRTALQNGLPTLAVLGHALNQIYPRQHQSLAKKILDHGAWISEYSREAEFDKNNFPMRNRIVAGLSDATILIESAASGGSMITAEIAHAYGRELFAVPGRCFDEMAQGALQLIKNMKAQIVAHPDDIAESLGWKVNNQLLIDNFIDHKIKYQHLDEIELKLVSFMSPQESFTIDSIHYGTEIPMNVLSSTLLSLEFKGVVISKPGKRFQLK